MTGPPPPRAHEPVPGNPYVRPPAPPAPARSATGAVVWILVAAVLAAVGAGVGAYAVLKEDGGARSGGFREPVTREPGAPAGPSGSGERTDRPGADGRAPRHVDVNAGRESGEARGRLHLNGTRLPGRGASLHDLWAVDGLVVQALYDTVTAYRVRDGGQAWSLRLPAPVCDTPVNAGRGGKVVVAYTNGNATNSRKCDRLQQIDLRTGAKGWRHRLTERGVGDSTLTVHLAISGDTLAVHQDNVAHAFRLSDGKRIFTEQRRRTGSCLLEDVAGGERLLFVDTCAPGAPKAHDEVRRIDPRTGKAAWRYRTKVGWNVAKVYSVDPLVLTVRNNEEYDKWAVVALDGEGKQRSWTRLDRGPHTFEMCAGAGDAGEGVQNCPGGVVNGDTLYLAGGPEDRAALGPDKVVAFDLATGRAKWAATVGKGKQGRQLMPVREAGPGKRAGVVVYVRAQTDRPGRTVRFGAAGGRPEVLLKHPTPAREWETFMFAGETLYSGGRLFVTPTRLEPDSPRRDDKDQGRMLSVGR
ncbi:PQQ-binding-like beta-propeller repeat protein [Streptomyces sp. CC224B]|uniref:outer membrane protein assembly factor BamB family protein n=1 Tax=Streptomyces sp. CC224B TaxID=3044571 RepID=UPI0024A9DDC6|nr:PQQ-binding-like beta-propeller repeat protein [Streptomyces sp. CC224B]